MIKTVIGINSAAAMQSGHKGKQTRDYRKELQDMIAQTEAVKNRLAAMTEEMDVDDLNISCLDEALDSLDDAIDIMNDALEDEEF